MNKTLTIAFSMICLHSLGGISSLTSASAYKFVYPGVPSQIIGKVMTDRPDYRILRSEDIAFLAEANFEIDTCHYEYGTPGWWPYGELPITENYDGKPYVDSSVVLKNPTHLYNYHNGIYVSDAAQRVNCVSNYSAASWPTYPISFIIDKGHSLSTGFKVEQERFDMAESKWLYKSLGISPEDERPFLSYDKIKTSKNQTPKLSVITNAYANVKEIQNCDTISMCGSSLSRPFSNGNFDLHDETRYSKKEFYTTWIGSNIVWVVDYTTNNPTKVTANSSGKMKFWAHGYVSKSMQTVVYYDDAKTNYTSTAQTEPSYTADGQRHVYMVGEGGKPYENGMVIYYMERGVDHIASHESAALVHVETSIKKDKSVWDAGSEKQITTSSTTNENYYMVIPIKLIRNKRSVSDTHYSWEPDFTSCETYFKEVINDINVIMDIDESAMLSLVPNPVAPDVNASTGTGGSNHNSLTFDTNITVLQIATRVVWRYNATFQ